MNFQNFIVPVMLFVVAQAILGIGALVKMWGTQIEQKTLFTNEISQIKQNIRDLEEHNKVRAADVIGINSQFMAVTGALGEIKGQLEILVSDRHEKR